MQCKFVVDQKVVTIGEWANPFLIVPHKNTIYTIREITIVGDGPGLRLREIINRLVRTPYGIMEPSFDACEFRPLQDRPKEADTDISIFEKLLNVEPAGVEKIGELVKRLRELEKVTR